MVNKIYKILVSSYCKHILPSGLGFKEIEFLGHHKEPQTFKISNLISKPEEGCFS